MKIKNIIKELISMLLILFVVSLVINYLRKPNIDENIYQMSMVDIEKKSVDIAKYKGELLVVHFWATWCPTCRLEANNIESVSKEYNLLSIAVSSGSDEKLISYMKKEQLSYKVINDNSGTLAKRFNIEAYPTTLIYNREGELIFTEVGYSTTLGLKARLSLID